MIAIMSVPKIPILIDKQNHVRMRNRNAAHHQQYGFLVEHAITSIIDRLQDTSRKFDHALIIDGGGGLIASHLARANLLGDKIATITEMDCAPNFITLAGQAHDFPIHLGDAEHMPFEAGSFDLVLSAWGLHWCNDIVGALIQINQILREDGAFFGCIPGRGSFQNLRQIMLEADSEINQGAWAHILPFADIADCGVLLGRAGFALPVIDSEKIMLTYREPVKLWQDLRKMGEGNALQNQQSLFYQACIFYQMR